MFTGVTPGTGVGAARSRLCLVGKTKSGALVKGLCSHAISSLEGGDERALRCKTMNVVDICKQVGEEAG